MRKTEQTKRLNDIIRFIYRSKAATVRHISKMFFKTEKRARHYLLWLERKKYLASTFIYSLNNNNPKLSGLMREKVYFLGNEGFKVLRDIENMGKGPDEKKVFYKYKVNMKELSHDVTVTDILIWFIKHHKGISSYKTDFEHRQEMNRRKEWFRMPDFAFTDQDGRYLVEYESSRRSPERIKHMADDYKAYYRDYSKIIVTYPENFKKYEKIFQERHIKNFIMATYDVKNGFKIHKEY
jgi:hypothetical protein